MDKDLLILGIESSCDETSAAVVMNGRTVLSNIINSQILIHKKYGGVVPEIASRNHTEHIDNVVREALTAADVSMGDIDAVAVTYGPGLVGALLVGLSFAKGLAYAAEKPLIGVNHIEGHVYANYINSDLTPPFMCLVVSGGHTHLMRVDDYGDYTLLGKTMDDSAGEAFDKVARAMGLTYPGGVLIDALAKQGDSGAIDFPRAMISDGFNFSFSGLKSAVLNYLNKKQMMNEEISKENVAASFQKALVDVLVKKSLQACREYNYRKLVLAGGVSCNSFLRSEIKAACTREGIGLYVPEPVFCTDNAAMIAACGYYEYIKGTRHGLDLNAYPSLAIRAKTD